MTTSNDLSVIDDLKRKADALEFLVEDLQAQNEVLRAELREVRGQSPTRGILPATKDRGSIATPSA